MLLASGLDYLMGDYFLEIRRRLRENREIGGEIIKVIEVANVPD
jgi:hypothetical protein